MAYDNSIPWAQLGYNTGSRDDGMYGTAVVYDPTTGKYVDIGDNEEYNSLVERVKAGMAPSYQQSQLQGANFGAGLNTPGMAINPRTGQQEQLLARTIMGENGGLDATQQFYFGSDSGQRPNDVSQAMAGGYSAGDGWGGGLGGQFGHFMDQVAPPAAVLAAALMSGGMAGVGPLAGGAAGATAGTAAGMEGALGSGLTAGTTTGGIGGGALGSGLSMGAASGTGIGGGALGTGIGAGAGGAAGLGAGSLGALGSGYFASEGLGGGSTGGGLLDWLGSSVGKGAGQTIGSSLATAGLNGLINAGLYNRAQHQASDLQSAQNPLNDPRRQPFQNAATNMVQNPQDYMQNNPFAVALGNYYRNGVIPAQFARSGNAGEVIDRNGSQFATAIAGNYNNLLGQLSGMGGYTMQPGTNGVPNLLMSGNQNLGEAFRGVGDLTEKVFGNIGRPGGQGGPAGLVMGGGSNQMLGDFPENPITGSNTNFA